MTRIDYVNIEQQQKNAYLGLGMEAQLLSAQVIKYPNSSSNPLICLKSFNRKYDVAFKTVS